MNTTADTPAAPAFLMAVQNDEAGLATLSDDEIDVRDELGRTPVMLAAAMGCLEAMNHLIHRGANLALEDHAGVPAWRYIDQFGSLRAEEMARLSAHSLLAQLKMKRIAGEHPGPAPNAHGRARTGL